MPPADREVVDTPERRSAAPTPIRLARTPPARTPPARAVLARIPSSRTPLIRRPLIRSALLLGTLCAGSLALASCSGPQSSLDPAGRGAQSIVDLLGWVSGGVLLVWAAVVLLAAYVIRLKRDAYDERTANLLIVGGGVIFPTVVLTVLLAFGLSLMPDLLAPPPDGSLRVHVSGEEWWWRIRYEPSEGEPFETANELRLPVGEPVAFTVSSPDVVHSFWIPALGPKIDMIPGRTNRLTLEPTRTGVFRGVCAEFCGTGHARMAFRVEVLEPEAFEGWMDAERADAEDTPDGGRLFVANGCGACHTIRGTPADGSVGPDLTHVGSRGTLAAGTLPNDVDALRRWIADPQSVKPGVRMPAFGMLPPAELDSIARYLGGLR